MTHRNLRALGLHGFHRMAYTEWGRVASPALLCVHGLTRTGRDFDPLAGALEARFRIVCPDLPGRGGSEWLPHPEDYGLPLYLASLAAVLARLDVEEVDWLGTSLGGILGLTLAAQPGSPIRRLVLNDVGPVIPRAAAERIAGYVGENPRFATLEELEAYLRRIHASFGPLTDGQWRHLATSGSRREADGAWRLHYDPAIGLAFRVLPATDMVLWPLWDAIRCPVLVLRGADSDLLLPSTLDEMRRRGPPVEVVEFPGVGHAPALLSEEQIGVVADWLRRRP
ncbi:MAG: alpha/beta fold hydrolase [Deltaproteobacteria bacterium]|nr:alpha/beta fold hydrolase [Deltaproteobacteria bacterium]